MRQEEMTLPGEYFRAGVGAVVLNAEGQALVLERSAIESAWQFPQGGLERGEDPLSAVLREINEETGIPRDRLRLLGQMPEPLAYVLPPESRSLKTGMGQVQLWFLFRYEGSNQEIRLPEEGESRNWAWRPMEQVVAAAVSFRRPVYEQVRAFLRSHVTG